jgi:drug/metabolite transporter (DMT)-like permease
VSRVEQHSGKAIWLMLGSVFFMSTMDAAIKILVADFHSFQVVFFRCLMSFPLFALWIFFQDRSLFRTHYPWGHLLRGLLGLFLLYAVSECFRELHLAEAYTLFFAAPLLITLLSGPILGEPAGRLRITIALVGFSGVLVALRPSASSLISYGATMGLLGMVAYSFTVLLLRRLGDKDNTVTIAFWFVTICGAGAGILAIPHWQPVGSQHWPMLLLLGITGSAGQILLTAAFRRASPAVIAPFDYTHMIFAVIYGFALWGYLPDVRTWFGAGIIVCSGLFIIYREHRIRQRQLRNAGKITQV